MKIDAMGDVCPVPVVKAKQALGTIDEGTVEMLVDNETSVHNLESFAKSQNCAVATEQLGDAAYSVKITKTADTTVNAPVPVDAGGTRVVAIGSQFMGDGDDTLGGNLMKAFIFALTQQDALPDTVLFYNGGAHLTCTGSASLEDIKKLADAGVEILTCGTCAKFYGIEDQVQVGDVTNMYVIVEKQMLAGTVIRP